MKRSLCAWIVVFFILFISTQTVSQAQTNALPVVESPVPASIVGSFYTDAAQSPHIQYVASWGSYLYLSVRYLNGDQKLEIWDVRDPAHPVLHDSLDFGNIRITPTDHWKFPSVNVFDDTIVVRSNFSDAVYYHDPTGLFTFASAHDFASEIGEMKNNEESLLMSSAASYGTFFGRLYDPYEVMPEEEYGYVILNFTNPVKPFVSTLVPPKTPDIMLQQFMGHLNGAMVNDPAVIRINNNLLSVFSRRVKADSCIDVFWKPRIPKIFDSNVLNRTIQSQIDRIVDQQPFAERFANVVEQFFEDLQIDAERTIEEAITVQYDRDAFLSDLLKDYRIGWDESVRTAVEKVISAHLTLNLEKQLSAELFSPAVSGWIDELFAIPTDASRDDIKNAVSNILNEGLSEETVARYVLDNYIAPYVDVPDWMFWTMEDMVDRIANSELGEVITGGISTANFLVNEVGFLEIALSFIPPAEQYLLPAGFPENCRDILEYAFFEHGAKLKRDGLAFMEMLKFYQYYQGNEGYLQYESEFAQSVKKMQEELSNALTETVEPFLSVLSYAGDVQERLQAFCQTIPCRQTISLAIRDAILVRLEAQGVDVDASVRVALKKYRLYLDLQDAIGDFNAKIARVEDWLGVLQNDLHESLTPIHTLWDESKANVSYVEDACRHALAQTLREAWGEIDLDQSLDKALDEFLGNHIDFRWTFGENMDKLLKDFVYSSLTEYPGFIEALELVKRADDGDVIARWQITFQLAALAASSNPFTLDQALIYESIEKALEEAYKQAMTSAVKMLLLEFANVMMRDMYGSFSAWATRTEAVDFSFQAGDLTSIKPIRNETFVWEKLAGLVSREEWDFIRPRKMALVLFDPLSPEDSKIEAILEGWGNVDYIHFHKGNLLVGGSMYEGFGIYPTGMLLSLQKDRVLKTTLHDLGISTATGMTGVNHEAHLVFYGPAGVFLVSNPLAAIPSSGKSDTGVRSWMCY